MFQFSDHIAQKIEMLFCVFIGCTSLRKNTMSAQTQTQKNIAFLQFLMEQIKPEKEHRRHEDKMGRTEYEDEDLVEREEEYPKIIADLEYLLTIRGTQMRDNKLEKELMKTKEELARVRAEMWEMSSCPFNKEEVEQMIRDEFPKPWVNVEYEIIVAQRDSPVKSDNDWYYEVVCEAATKVSQEMMGWDEAMNDVISEFFAMDAPGENIEFLGDATH